jgi:hypothetical protein
MKVVYTEEALKASVARMSEAISGVFAFGLIPACRCAHAGYWLPSRAEAA